MGGLWVCLVSLLLLAPQPSFTDHPFVGEPPAFSTEPPADKVVDLDTFVQVNDLMVNLVLPCATTGTPAPTVTWYREGTLLDEASVMPDGRLAVNVTMTEAARGGTIYYCVATNTIGGDHTEAALRSRDVNVSHSFFDGFEATMTRDVAIETVEGGAVALECDFLASNPAPMVQWFSDETTQIEEDRLNNNAVLYLEGGRYLFIRALSAAQRTARFHCEVTNLNFRSDDGFPLRAPTTYTLSTPLANVGLTEYRALGTQIGTVGVELEFVYAATSRNDAGTFATINIDCDTTPQLVLGTGSTYVITAELREAAETMDEVEFTCTVFVLGTPPTQETITGRIIVSRPASITNPLQGAASLTDRERLVGTGAVTYPCVSSGIPDPTITWLFNGAELQDGAGAVTNADNSLSIAEPQVSNSGIYQCIASNMFGEDRRAWVLEVVMGEPPAFSTEPPADKVVDLDTFVQVNDLMVNLVLPCATTGTPAPTVTWYREETLLDEASVMPDGRLAVNVTMAEAARGGTIYYCVAANTIGGDHTEAALRSRDVNVSHSFFDGFEEMMTRDVAIETVEGGAVALECDFLASNPAPMVQWFSDETTQIEEDRLNNNAVLYLEGGRYLFIRALSAAQRTARFHCEVTNLNFRSDDGFPLRAPTTYTLSTPLANVGLTEYRALGTQIGTVGVELEFVYAATSRNDAGTFATINIDCDTTPQLVLGTGSTYVITAELREAAETMDEVEFTCTVFVLGTPPTQETITGRIIVSRPASITNPLQGAASLTDRERLVGTGAVTYPCISSGIPDPTITWLFNGAELQDGAGAVTNADNSLSIAEPQVSNSGIYQCIASNMFGEDRRAWVLEVREPVIPDIMPLTTTSGAVEDRLEGNLIVQPLGTLNQVITVVVNSDPCPTVQWMFRGMNVTDGEAGFTVSNPCGSGSSPYTFTLTIANLTEATSGRYSALFTLYQLRNVSVPLPSLFVTVPNDTIVVQGLDIMVEVDRPQAPSCLLLDSNVVLTCETAGFPRPDIIFRNESVPIVPGGTGFERVTQISMDQIRIMGITSYDQAQYTCEARTRPLDGSPSEILILTPTPDRQVYCTEPRITDFSQTQDPREGSQLLIECTVEGVPLPEVTWTKNNVTLDSNLINISPARVSQVRIESASTENSGVYRCNASNAAGSVTQALLVEVSGGDSGNSVPTSTSLIIAGFFGGLAAGMVIMVAAYGLIYCMRRHLGQGCSHENVKAVNITMESNQAYESANIHRKAGGEGREQDETAEYYEELT